MKKILFSIALCLSTTIYLFQKATIPLPSWLNNYMNDFLVLPLVLSICLYVVRILKRDAQLQLPIPLILVVTSIYCVYFEWYLPLHQQRYTGDWIDCILYFTGAFVFYLLQNKKITLLNN